MMTETAVRESLRSELLARSPGLSEALYEFWVPRTNERADVVAIGSRLWGFEIKTDRDTLARLPRQVQAYSRLFDRCAVVVAERHLDAALGLIPDWWGAASILADGTAPSFRIVRWGQPNHAVDAETLVRLLWRDEVRCILASHGAEPDARASRASMWQLLLGTLDLGELKSAVCQALLNRGPSPMRFAGRRSRSGEVSA
jgi:hypothetical protein